jgi:hypothetical protein
LVFFFHPNFRNIFLSPEGSPAIGFGVFLYDHGFHRHTIWVIILHKIARVLAVFNDYSSRDTHYMKTGMARSKKQYKSSKK